MISAQTVEDTKQVVDYISVTTVVATIMGYMPEIAALFTVIWAIFRALNEINKWRRERKQDGETKPNGPNQSN